MKQILALLICSSMAFPAFAREKSESVAIKGGEVHEICMSLEFARKLDYAFMASRDLEFSIRYEDGGEVIFPVPEHAANEKADLFTAMEDKDHCLMWNNTHDRTVKMNVVYTVR